MKLLYQCFLTFIACIAISIHYNVKGKLFLYSSLGGAVTFSTYLLTSPLHSVAMQSFCASIIASIYSEALARILKVPATTFLIIAIIPLVPGSNLYYTMRLCIANQIMDFITSALATLWIAGAIALGILLVSSMFRFVVLIQRKYAYKAKRSR